MKNLFTLFISSLLTMGAFAQAPEMMSYQAVVRDASDNLVASSPVGMQVSILQGSPSGTAAYVETQTPTSNQNGLVSIEIGNGTLVSGNFSTIDWANGPYFIKTESDPTGGASYTITGTSQLLSVPYAMYAKNSSGWQTIDDTTHSFNQIGIGTTSTYPGVELILNDDVFASQVIESTGATTDAELWLKNPTGTWRMHGDQSDENKLKFGLWTDYSEAGGSNILPESLTIDTLGRVGIGNGVNFKEAFNVYHPDSAFIQIETGGNNIAGLVMKELNGLRGARIIVDGTNTNNLIFQVTDDFGEYVDVMHMPFFPGSLVGNVGIGTDAPARKLHINDVMRLEPRATAPANPSKGDIYMNDTTNKLMVYDGTVWQACW